MASILRYPYDALTDKTDYLQIDIREYQSVQQRSGSLVSGGSQRDFNMELFFYQFHQMFRMETQ